MDPVRLSAIFVLLVGCAYGMPIETPSEECVIDESVFQVEFEKEKFEGKWFIDHDGSNTIIVGKWNVEYVMIEHSGKIHFHDDHDHMFSTDIEGQLTHAKDVPWTQWRYTDDTHTSEMHIVSTDYNTAIVYERLISETDHLGHVGDSQVYYLSREPHLTEEQRTALYSKNLDTALCLHQDKSCSVDQLLIPENFDITKVIDQKKWFVVQDGHNVGKWRADHVMFMSGEDGATHVSFHDGGLLEHHQHKSESTHRHLTGDLTVEENPGNYIFADNEHSTQIRFVWTNYNTALVYEKLLTSESADYIPGSAAIYWISKQPTLSEDAKAKIGEAENELYSSLCLYKEGMTAEDCDVLKMPLQADFDIEQFISHVNWYIIKDEEAMVGKWRANHVVFSRDDAGELHMAFHDGGLIGDLHDHEEEHEHINGKFTSVRSPGDYEYTDATHSTHMRFVLTTESSILVYEQLLSDAEGETHVGKPGDAAIYQLSTTAHVQNEEKSIVDQAKNRMYNLLCIEHPKKCIPSDRHQDNFELNKFIGKWYIAQENQVHVGKWRADHLSIEDREDGVHIEFHDGPFDTEHYVKGTLKEDSPAHYTYTDSTHTTHFRIVWTDYNIALVYERLINATDDHHPGASDAYFIHRHRDLSTEESEKVKSSWAELTPSLCLTNHEEVTPAEKCVASDRHQENFEINKFTGKWYIAQENQVHVGKWRADHLLIEDREDGVHIGFHDGPFDTEHYVKGTLKEDSPAHYTYTDSTHTTQFRIVWTDYNIALIYERLVSSHDGVGSYGESDAYFIHRHRDLSAEESEQVKSSWDTIAPGLCLTHHEETKPSEKCVASDRHQEDFEMNKFTGKWYIAQENQVHVGKWRADHLLIEDREDGVHIGFHDGPFDTEHYVKGTLKEDSLAHYTYTDSTHTTQFRIVWTDYNIALIYERLVSSHDGVGSYGESDAYFIHRHRDLSAEESEQVKSSWDTIAPGLCLTHHEETKPREKCVASDRHQEDFEMNKFTGKWYIAQENQVHVGKWRADHLLIEDREDGVHIEFHDGPLNTEHYVKGTLTKDSTAHYTYTDSTHTTQFRIVWTDYNIALLYERLVSSHDGVGSYGESDAYFIHRNRDLSTEESEQVKSSWDTIAPGLCLTHHEEVTKHEKCQVNNKVADNFELPKFTGKWYIAQENQVHVGKWRADHLLIEEKEDGIHIEFHDGPLDTTHYVQGMLEGESTAVYTYTDETHKTQIRIVWTDFNIALVYERLINAHDGLGSYGDSDAYFIHRHRELSEEERNLMKISWDEIVPKLCLTHHEETKQEEHCEPDPHVPENFELSQLTGKWFIDQKNQVHVGKWRADHILIEDSDEGIHIEFHDGPFDTEHYVKGTLTEKSKAEFAYSDDKHSTQLRVVWTDNNIALVYERLINSHDGVGRYGDSDAYFIHRNRDISVSERELMDTSWAEIIPKLCLTKHSDAETEDTCTPVYRVQEGFEIEKFEGEWFIAQENRERVGKWRASHLEIQDIEGEISIEFHDGPSDEHVHVTGKLVEKSLGDYEYHDSTHTSTFRIVWSDYNMALVYERLIASHDGIGHYGDSDAYFLHRDSTLSIEDSEKMDAAWARLVPKLCLTHKHTATTEGSGESSGEGSGDISTVSVSGSGEMSSGDRISWVQNLDIGGSGSVGSGSLGSGEAGSGLIDGSGEFMGSGHIDVGVKQTCAEMRDSVNHDIKAGLVNGTPLMGAEPPICEEDGTYSAKQCSGSVCYCVVPEGGAMEEFEEVNRWNAEHLTCGCAREKATNDNIQCDKIGNYSPVQCSDTMCYCVDPSSGATVEGTQLALAEKDSLMMKCANVKEMIMPKEAAKSPN